MARSRLRVNRVNRVNGVNGVNRVRKLSVLPSLRQENENAYTSNAGVARNFEF